MTPFFPLGFGRVNDRRLAYGVKGPGKAYLSVFTIDNDAAEIPLDSLGAVKGVKVIYPESVDCDFSLENGALRVKMPAQTCARLFEIELD